jgi:hypothetical protein
VSVARTVLVTIATLKREVDVVAHADVTQPFTMAFTQTLDEAGVADGDRLSLHPFTQRPFTRQSPRALQVEWSGGEN